MYRFKELLLDEDLMMIMKANKKFRELWCDGEYVVNLLKDKKFNIKNIGYSLDTIKWARKQGYT